MYYIEDGEAGQNASKALKSCCLPNTIHTESQNAQWCEIPSSFFENLPEPGVDDLEASRWLQGNFTLCQMKQTTVGAHYCNLPSFNTHLSVGSSIQGQYQLGFACLIMWLWVWLRLN